MSAHGPTGDLEKDKADGRLLDAAGKVTSLQVPHRLADAILRDSEVQENGASVAFRRSARGKSLNTVSAANATPLFELCPTALLKGVVAPSAISHSSVPFPKDRKQKTDDNHFSGATIEYAERVTTLSLICLRRLRFPVNGKDSPEAILARTGACSGSRPPSRRWG